MAKKHKEPEKKNAVIYTRVSTEDQVNNLSLSTQEDKSRELCWTSGWNLVRIFREEGKSAKTTQRDQFQQMLRFCRDPKNSVGWVVVYNLSRFARTMIDQVVTIAELERLGVGVRSCSENIDDTPTGKLLIRP